MNAAIEWNRNHAAYSGSLIEYYPDHTVFYSLAEEAFIYLCTRYWQDLVISNCHRYRRVAYRVVYFVFYGLTYNEST